MPLGCSAVCKGVDRVGVQVRYRKAQVIVSPNQVSVIDAVVQEFFFGKECANVRVLGIAQERTEVDDLFGAVIELQAQAVASYVLRVCHIDDGRVHGSGLVIFSVETDLWRTK